MTYLSISLIYGLLSLGIIGSLMWWRLIYPKLLTEYGMRLCSLSFLTLGFFVNRAIFFSFPINYDSLRGFLLIPALLLLFINDLLSLVAKIASEET